MNVNDVELIRLIKGIQEPILARTDDSSPLNTADFRQLISLLTNFANSAPCAAFCFYLPAEIINKIDIERIAENLSNGIQKELQTNNFLVVNELFEVQRSMSYNPADSVEAKSVYRNLSKGGNCVILIINGLYSTYYNEVELSTSVFTAEADIKSYTKKLDISDVFEVLNQYREYLADHNNVYKFFVDKYTLKTIYGTDYKKNCNLLRNSPENDLREDLKKFLSGRIRRTFNFSRENQLDSKKRLDINTEDSMGNYYFFEVKWLGKSVHKKDPKEGTVYDAKDIPDGYVQALNYIHELKNNMNKTVRFGCLIIFDARQTKTSLEWCFDDKHLNETQKQHKGIFRRLEPFAIDNATPK